MGALPNGSKDEQRKWTRIRNAEISLTCSLYYTPLILAHTPPILEDGVSGSMHWSWPHCQNLTSTLRRYSEMRLIHTYFRRSLRLLKLVSAHLP